MLHLDKCLSFNKIYFINASCLFNTLLENLHLLKIKCGQLKSNVTIFPILSHTEVEK